MDAIIFKIEIIAQQWFALMTASSIQLGVFLLLILIIASIFKKQSARFLYLVWLIGLLKIFIPPTIKLPAFFSNATIILDNQIPSLLIPEIHVVSASSATLSYQGYLFLAWAAVVLTLFCYWLFQLIRFRVKVTGTSIEITDQNLFDTRILNGDRVRIFTGANISMPFTKGIFQPKIYLPESALSWQVNELNALILHEYAHIKRKDLFFITLQNVMQLLFFFHPMVWLANRQISRYREKACDDFAIHALQGKATEYGRLLLKSIDEALDWKPIPSMSISFHQSKKFLLQRFHYILNRKESIMTKLKLSQKLVLIGLIIFGIALSCQKQ
ncbi:M56 family metallopeptidase, partial [candidate division KSB1 bacterium]|nr:M56 family metallopeptidase [candidate division KSB1 bacterium]